MDDHKIDIHTGSGVGRGTQSIFNPKVKMLVVVSGKMLVVVSGSLRWVWQLTRGHVNRPESLTPIGKAEDREGTQPQNIISSPKETIENITDKPQIVSLGPFHPPNETLKDKILRIKNEDSRFQELVNNIKRDGQSIRQWYNKHDCQCRHSDEELGRMMARDGLFLLQFLREISHGAKCPASRFTCSFKDIRVRLSQQPFAVQKDVMMISNQIPLFVLQKILLWEAQDEWESSMDQDLNSILAHAWSNLCPIRCMSGSPGVRGGYWHLLEFVYENIIGRDGATVRGDRENIICCLPKRRTKKRGNSRITLPTAVELKARGVKFGQIVKFDQIEGPLAQICFDPGNLTLYLPTIEMTGRADVVLRNLVEFEKSKPDSMEQPLMSYVNMMDRLVNKAEDVEILRNCGIIHNHLGTDDDVASVWNGMRKILLEPEKIEYEPIDNAVDGVISFCTDKRRKMCAEFKRKHCSKPWLVIPVISAVILLGLTVLQTYLAWEQVRLQRESMHQI